ncbi:MAG: hypothetical protein RL371_643 [Bacteroidota bacterium]
MIGQDFPKIQWDIFDLQLLEPNAMFGDIVLFAMSLLFAAQIRKMNRTQPFFHYWRLFFAWFGWSFILGVVDICFITTLAFGANTLLGYSEWSVHFI